MKKLDYKKYLPKAVVAILCIFFVVGVVWGANVILKLEGTQIPYVPAQSLSSFPETPSEVVEYINSAILNAVELKPKLNSSERLRIDSDSITADNMSDMLLTAANNMLDGIEDAVEGSHKDVGVDYFQGFDGILKPLQLAIGDIEALECNRYYYKCPICSENSSEMADVCPECKGVEPLELRHSDEYEFTIKLRNGSRAFSDNFEKRSAADVDAIIADKAEGFFSHGDVKVAYGGAQIKARVNRLTDRLISLEFSTAADVEVSLTFLGAYSYLGTVQAAFSASDTLTYRLTWPGLKLSANSMSIEPKNTDVLKATLTCDNPVDYDVIWSSSDESIASVDDEGYIKAKKVDGIVTITAQFDFKGVTYSDSCEVYVKTSVEGVDISDRSLSLSVGDARQLTASVSPRKATVKTVKWYTADSSVAAVSEDGAVTAVAAGKTTVYALSDDGYYKASCEVEVTA